MNLFLVFLLGTTAAMNNHSSATSHNRRSLLTRTHLEANSFLSWDASKSGSVRACYTPKPGRTAGKEMQTENCEEIAEGNLHGTFRGGSCNGGNSCIAGCGNNGVGSPGEKFVVCARCPANTYSTGKFRQACLRHSTCEAGLYAHGGSSTKDVTCSSCAAGKFSSTAGATTCTACPDGQYQDLPGSDSCTDLSPCGKGTYEIAMGDATSDNECATCPPGKVSNKVSSSCDECAVGLFQSAHGKDSCLPCPGGKNTTKAGAVGCSSCEAGQFKDAAASVCKKCAAGFHQGQEGAEVCEANAGETISAVGATEATPCLDYQYTVDHITCLDNTCVCVDAMGTPVGVAVETEKCPVNGASVCKTCDPGYNLRHGDCQRCPKGTSSPNGKCVACKPGKFQPHDGQTSCVAFKKCGGGSEVKVGGTHISNVECGYCDTGMYSDDNKACKNCEAGKYNPGVGANGCRTCPAGSNTTTKTVGNVGCTKCEAGQFDAPQEDGTTRCTNCPGGFFGPGDGASECQPVSGNFISFDGATQATPCPAGKHTNDHLVCVDNQCTCDNGVAAGGIACITNGAEICQRCNSNWRLIDQRCDINCANGYNREGNTCSRISANCCAWHNTVCCKFAKSTASPFSQQCKVWNGYRNPSKQCRRLVAISGARYMDAGNCNKYGFKC